MGNPSSIDLPTLLSGNGFYILGKSFLLDPQNSTEELGFSVSAAGDINNDGIGDLLVGARHADVGDKDKAGKSFIIFGSATIAARSDFDLASLNGTNGFAIQGINPNDRLGQTVSNIGDFNKDGADDLAIGSFSNGGNIYIIFGKQKAATFSPIINLETLNANSFQGFSYKINPPAGERQDNLFGFSISAAGDVNQDGAADFIVGAPGNSLGFGPGTIGKSYVVYGRSLNSANDVAGITSSEIRGITPGDRAGNSVSGVGDVDGDQIPDFLIAARDANGNAGQSYLVFGSALNANGAFLLDNLNGSNGFKLNGTGRSGWAVSGAGDVDGDGKKDLIIGAPSLIRSPENSSAPIDPNSPGKAYLILGKHLEKLRSEGASGTLDLATNAFVITGDTNGDGAGFSVSAAGDINADGFADLVVGAPFADPDVYQNGGKTYVIYGREDISTGGSLNLKDLTGEQGFVLKGASTNGLSGWSVSKAGDVNGDRVDDLIIGAPQNQGDPGISYILFGNARPSLDLDSDTGGSDFATLYRIGNPAIAIVAPNALTLTDNTSSPTQTTIKEAVIRITNLRDGSAETLSADASGTNITATYTADTGTLKLTGVDTVANYQRVLSTLKYQNTATNPNFESRTIEFVVSDIAAFNTDSPVAKSVVHLLAPPKDVFYLEAEALTLNTYRVEANAFASGGKVISLKDATGTTGTVSTQFTGKADNYTIVVDYVDEADGKATLDFQVNSKSVDRWILDKELGSNNAVEQTFAERLIKQVQLKPGDTLSIQGTKNGGEETRVDAIQIVPTRDLIQIEAEAMQLSTYQVEDNRFASGKKLISLKDATGATGTASIQFTGQPDFYDITVGYLDEADGQAKLAIQANGKIVDNWVLDKNLGSNDPLEQTFVERTIKGVALSAGSTLALTGTRDREEWARVDFLRITPTIAGSTTTTNSTFSSGI